MPDFDPLAAYREYVGKEYMAGHEPVPLEVYLNALVSFCEVYKEKYHSGGVK